MAAKLAIPIIEGAAGALAASSASGALSGAASSALSASGNLLRSAQQLFWDPQIGGSDNRVAGDTSSDPGRDTHPLLERHQEEVKNAQVAHPFLVRDDGTHRTQFMLRRDQHPEDPLILPRSRLRPMLVDGGYSIFGTPILRDQYLLEHPRANAISLDQYNEIVRQQTGGLYDDPNSSDNSSVASSESDPEQPRGRRFFTQFVSPQSLYNSLVAAHKAKKVVEIIQGKTDRTAAEDKVLRGYNNLKRKTEIEFPNRRYYIYITIENGKPVFHRLLQPQDN